MISMPTISDSATEPAALDPLVARLKAGDEDAFAEVVRTLGGRMLSVARRFMKDEDAARDVVQDAFLSAFRAIQGFDGDAQLSTWLHRIVVNAALMRLRRKRRKCTWLRRSSKNAPYSRPRAGRIPYQWNNCMSAGISSP